MLLCFYEIGEKEYKVREKCIFLKVRGQAKYENKTVVQHAY